jgi:hypothetical protein
MITASLPHHVYSSDCFLALPLLAIPAAVGSIPSLAGKGNSPTIYSVAAVQRSASNSSIGGRLGAGRPSNFPSCLTKYKGKASTPDGAACKAAGTNNPDSNFIAEHFRSYK